MEHGNVKHRRDTGTLQCSICFRDIPEEPSGWRGGHNAQPINDGRCCGACNMRVVVPARMTRMQRRDD